MCGGIIGGNIRKKTFQSIAKILWNGENGVIYFFFFSTENIDKLPELTPVQLSKLRHLTIVSMATKNKVA